MKIKEETSWVNLFGHTAQPIVFYNRNFAHVFFLKNELLKKEVIINEISRIWKPNEPNHF